MDTQSRFPTMVSGDTLYIAFNGISNRSTDYFVAASDTVTLTAYATTESATILEFKAALWELSDDQTKTSYLQGSTVYFPTGGECSTYTVSGLTPGKMYKVDGELRSAQLLHHRRHDRDRRWRTADLAERRHHPGRL